MTYNPGDARRCLIIAMVNKPCPERTYEHFADHSTYMVLACSSEAFISTHWDSPRFQDSNIPSCLCYGRVYINFV